MKHDGYALLKSGMRKKKTAVAVMAVCVVLFAFICLFVGSSHMSVSECFRALFKTTDNSGNIRIIWNIRIPRVLTAIIAGAGLSVSGLIMQTTLTNVMASPSTLGVSNAAVFGANLSIIAFAGGFLSTGNNLANYTVGANPFATSLIAFLFSACQSCYTGLCRLRSFSPGLSPCVLAVAPLTAEHAFTVLLDGCGLSAAVIWNFGDLGRATYETDLILLVAVTTGVLFFSLMSWRYNALLSGDAAATSMGVNVSRLRFISLLLASMITAVCVSFLGIIGFVGIICPHIVKKLLGQDHRLTIPASVLGGSLLLLIADTFSRAVGNGSALPVGAITTLLGAPFFVAIIFSGKEKR